jgi:hypothetical protein
MLPDVESDVKTSKKISPKSVPANMQTPFLPICAKDRPTLPVPTLEVRKNGKKEALPDRLELSTSR